MLELPSGCRHHGKRMISCTQQLVHSVAAHLQRTRQQLANHLCTTVSTHIQTYHMSKEIINNDMATITTSW